MICGQLSREPHQPRLVDARRVQTRDEERRAVRRADRLVNASPHRSTRRRDCNLALPLGRRVEIGDATKRAVHFGRANHERQAVHERPRDEHAARERHDDNDGGDRPSPHDAHVTLASRFDLAGMGSPSCPSRPSCPMKQLVIAIDGPSGAGKGTVARAVAAQLGYRHVDSGAMYRAVGWKALRDGVPLDSDDGVAALAERSIIDVTPPLITIDGSDVTRAIRTPEIDRAAAAVARLPKVRAVLVERQRECGTQGAIVMEGRDIGTVVFPNADVKIYLDASPDERARRRAADPAHSGGPTAVADV